MLIYGGIQINSLRAVICGNGTLDLTTQIGLVPGGNIDARFGVT
jgi:hypothetical protein